MNHFPEILKIIGLKPEEKFDLIDASDNVLFRNVRFTDTGSLLGADEQSVPNDAILLRDVIRGIYTVRKKTWRPDDGEPFFFVDRTGILCQDTWIGTTAQLAMLAMKNVFKKDTSISKEERERIVETLKAVVNESQKTNE